jgi:uncharacterized repeat protein (TIGR01451 family)
MLPLAAQTPLQQTLAQLRAEGLPPGLTEADLTDLELTDQYTDAHNGVTHVYWRQRHQGLVVEQSYLSAHLNADGDVISIQPQLAGKLASRCQPPVPSLDARGALYAAMQHLGQWEAAIPPVLSQGNGPEQPHTLAGGSLSVEPIPARLAYLADERGDIHLAWYLRIYPPGGEHWWNLWVDAQDGEILRQQDWVVSCEPASLAHTPQAAGIAAEACPEQAGDSRIRTPEDGSSYLVFAEPLESPAHGPQSLVLTPADSLASPFGWHDIDGRAGAEFTYLRGNNAWSRLDLLGDNDPNGYSPEGGLGLDFRFPFDSGQAINGLPNQQAALTNLFYWNNLIHDVWYHKGFDEAAGNFQTNNYGRGGIGGDFVIAEAQDGGGSNNANFATPPDGFNGRMQMYLWNTTLRNSLVVGGNSPAAGGYATAPFGLSVPLPDSALMAPLIRFVDSAGSYEACAPAANAAELDGAIALIDRGSCNFDLKIIQAQTAGAIGAVIVNNQPEGIFGIGGNDPNLTIPTVMISFDDGERIKASLSQGLTASLVDSKNVGGYPSDLDNAVIAHEYGHGISIRLTGGPATSCLSGEEQAGEGWSDWFGLVMTHRPGDQGRDPRGIGSYVRGETPLGAGIRRYPYSTDLTINPATYNDIRLSSVSVPHGVGSVMCSMLWDLYWALIDRYGYDPDLIHGEGGNHVAMQLVIDGLKLQPCSPGFVDVRDAILLADELAYGGNNRCLIWEAFARRGLGYSADQGSGGSRDDNEEAFDLPPLCQDILYLAKTTEQTTVSPGDTIRYEFLISNRSGSLLTGVEIQDELPPQLRYLPDGSACTSTETSTGFALSRDDLPNLRFDTCQVALLVDPAAAVSRYLSQDSLTGSLTGYQAISQTGSNGWDLLSGQGQRGTPAFFVPNVGADNDQVLMIPPFTPDTNTVFTFWHRFHTEAGWDGGLVEFQLVGIDTTWRDLGAYFVRAGYNNAVGRNNPAGARSAFGGNSQGYQLTWAEVGDFAGQPMRVRFRFVSDNNTFEEGWYIDAVGLLLARTFRNVACVVSDQGEQDCATQAQETYLVAADLLTSVPAAVRPTAGALRVYPNPAQEQLTLALSDWSPGNVQITLINLLGQPLWQAERAVGRAAEVLIPVGTLSPGVYLLRVQQGKTQHLRRVRIE